MANHDPIPDRYRRVRSLGEGGSGRVELVEDLARGGLPLALKILDSDRPVAELREEFLRLADLRHPNLVSVHTFHIGPPACFSMDYVEGVDVLQHLSVAPDDGPELAAEALRALAFLHDVGLIHRDLKPANLLVRAEAAQGNRLVVLDFGLAVAASSRTAELSGTLPYLAPELLRGEPPSRRTDLFALGAVLHHALLGAPPVDPTDRSTVEVISRLRDGRFDRVAGGPASSALTAWIERLVHPDPAERPSSARDALIELGRAQGGKVALETGETRTARLRSGDPPGREDELRLVAEALASLETGVVLLRGGRGLGKTRVLASARRRAIADGWHATDDVDVARSLVEAPQQSSERTLLVIDDLDRATGEVRSLVDRLARERFVGGVKALVSLTSASADDVLGRLVQDADVTPRIVRIDVGPLGTDGVAVAVRRSTGRDQVDGDRLAWLLEASGGVPMLLELLLADEAWERGEAAGVSSVADVTALRLASVERSDRDIGAALAVIGGPVTVRQLAELLDRPVRAMATSLERLIEHGIVGRTGERVALGSRVVRDALRAETTVDRRRQLASRALALRITTDPSRLALLHAAAGNRSHARRLGEALAQEADGRSEPVARAWWLRFAASCLQRSDARATAFRLTAASALRGAGQSSRPLALTSAVLRVATDSRVKARAHRLRARLLVVAGRNEECLLEAERAAENARLAGDTDLEAATAVERAFALTHLGRAEEADRLLQESVGRMEDAEARLESHGWIVSVRSMRGWEGIEGHVASADRLLGEVQSPLARANYLIIRAIHERRHGDRDRAMASAEQAFVLARQHRLRRPEILARSISAGCSLMQGRFDVAIRLAREAAESALHYGFPGEHLTTSLTAESAAVAVGRIGEAVGNLEWLASRPWLHRSMEKGAVILLNLAESLVALRPIDSARIRQLLDTPPVASSSHVTIRAGRALVALELAAADTREEGEEAWASFSALLDDGAIPFGEILVRGLLARARRLVADGRASEALSVLERALEALGKAPMPALTAHVYAVRVAAHEALGDRAAVQAAVAAGRARLDEAAGRIEDPELRADFLAQPKFAVLRNAGAEASPAEDRLVALYDMIRRLNSESDPDRVLESMLDMALRVVGAERGMILLRGHGGLDFDVRLARNLEHETIRDVETFSRNVVLRAGAGQPVLAVDTGNDERVREWRSVSLYGIRSVLCVPLRSRGEIIGAVYLDSRGAASVFDDEDLRFLEAFADHAALALENARRVRRLEDENRRLQVAAESRWRFDDIIGRSAAMQRLYDLVPKYAATELPVLVVGDSGTGKELFAKAIHRNGSRRERPFLTENCAAISETLLESELFGHVRGAFTGAERDRAGLFEQANGGTLFLDEVGDMSASMQARLLRVLQEGEIRRVGDDRRIDVDVRVIAATHRDLPAEVEAGRFREDLMYRLQVLVLSLPPLRERLGDVPLLVRELLERISAARGAESPPRMAPQVLDLLERYAWPGNVRELENVLQRLALLAGDDAITIETVESDRGLVRSLLPHGAGAPPVLSLERSERERIRQALDATSGNRARAAKLLGISRATIFRKIKQFELS